MDDFAAKIHVIGTTSDSEPLSLNYIYSIP